jgi:hypothetical protein
MRINKRSFAAAGGTSSARLWDFSCRDGRNMITLDNNSADLAHLHKDVCCVANACEAVSRTLNGFSS